MQAEARRSDASLLCDLRVTVTLCRWNRLQRERILLCFESDEVIVGKELVQSGSAGFEGAERRGNIGRRRSTIRRNLRFLGRRRIEYHGQSIQAERIPFLQRHVARIIRDP